jgi:hypothetical protein
VKFDICKVIKDMINMKAGNKEPIKTTGENLEL